MIGKKEDEYIELEYPLKVINRDMLKYIAALMMLLYHIAVIFLPTNLIAREVMADLGFFATITACYCLVEGYYHTHDLMKYGINLLVFAIISELPYCVAFSTGDKIRFVGLNIIFSLYFCLLILYVKERVHNVFLKLVFILLLLLGCIFCEWSLFPPIFVLLFAWAYKEPQIIETWKDPRRIKAAKEKASRAKWKGAFYFGAILFGIYNFFFNLGYASIARVIVYACGSMVGLLLAAIVILYFYNGEVSKTEPKKSFNKWFFYGFYPCMLLICGIVRLVLGL